MRASSAAASFSSQAARSELRSDDHAGKAAAAAATAASTSRVSPSAARAWTSRVAGANTSSHAPPCAGRASPSIQWVSWRMRGSLRLFLLPPGEGWRKAPDEGGRMMKVGTFRKCGRPRSSSALRAPSPGGRRKSASDRLHPPAVHRKADAIDVGRRGTGEKAMAAAISAASAKRPAGTDASMVSPICSRVLPVAATRSSRICSSRCVRV